MIVRSLIVLACVLATPAPLVFAQTFPERPVLLINPFPAGGTLDTTARLLAQKMSEAVGRPVVVENRTGAGGVVGTLALAKAAPDGHTIAMVANNFATAPAIRTDLPYDTLKDFAPIIFVGWLPQILAVSSSLPVHSVKELVALAKEKPGSISYGTLGDGSMGHFVGKKFESVTGVQLIQVPFRGSAQTLGALVGGHISMTFGNAPEILEYAKSGRMKALAALTPARIALATDLPTIGEAGYPQVISQAWYGFVAPAGTSPAIVSRWNQEINRALDLPDVKQRLNSLGLDLSGGRTPAFFSKLVRDEIAMFTAIAKEAKITASP
jgi:tripartite-type tricarboxylate transporter receptor subunit TctC